MTKLPTPKNEEDKMTCPDCEMSLVARLKTYQDNTFPAYVQWQNTNETKAHKTKDGNCAGITTTSGTHDTSDTTTILGNITQKIVNEKYPDSPLDETTKTIVNNEATLLYKIKKEVEVSLKDVVIDIHYADMVWGMTELIWQKYFRGKEK